MVIIRHTGLVTKNLKKSLQFWKNILKFKIKKDQIEKGPLIDKVLGYKNVKVRTIKLEDKNKNLIEILYFQNAPYAKINKVYPYSIGYTHISVTVKDIFKIYKFLRKEKIKFNSKPEKSQDGKVFMTYCKTPEGGYLELVQEV